MIEQAVKNLNKNFQFILSSYIFFAKIIEFDLNYIIALFYTLVSVLLYQNCIEYLNLKLQMDYFFVNNLI